MRPRLPLALLAVAAFIIGFATSQTWPAPSAAPYQAPIVSLSTALLMVLYQAAYQNRAKIAAIYLAMIAGCLPIVMVYGWPALFVLAILAAEPVVLTLLLIRSWRRRERTVAAEMTLSYCVYSVLVALGGSLLVTGVLAVFSQDSAHTLLSRQMAVFLSHAAAYLGVAPVLVLLVVGDPTRIWACFREQWGKSVGYIATGAAIVIAASTLYEYAQSETLSQAAPWLFVLLAPLTVLAAFRMRNLVTTLLITVSTILVLFFTYWSIGPMDQLEGNQLRLLIAISCLSAVLMLGLIDKLTRMLDEARAAIKERNRFLASVSHELKSSLTGVIGAAELMQKEMPHGADRHDRLGLIQRTGVLMSRLIEDALDYSEMGQKGIVLSPVDFSLADAVRDCVELFKARLDDKGVALRIDVGEFDDWYIHADGARIRQVLINLLSNACKFTQSGEVAVVLRSRHIEDGQVRCEIDVSDTGPGVPDAKKREIFEAFARSLPSDGGGLGLGLAISQDIARAMEGALGVFDREGGGARFRLKFVAPRVEKSEATARVAPSTDAMVSEREYSILLAEDNHSSRIILEAMLAAAGLNVTCVDNGEEAVKAVSETPFDLVLMDMHMPRMSGPAAIMEIRHLANGASQTPILVISGNEGESVKDELKRMGVSGLITKPISAERLIVGVYTALHADSDETGFIAD